MRWQPARVAVGLAVVGMLVWSGRPLTGVRAPLVNASAQAGPDLPDAVSTYCATCHNGVTRSASGALLDRFDAARIAESPGVWARAYRQLQAGAMPPAGAPRPDGAAAAAMLTAIEQALSVRAKPSPPAGGAAIAIRLATMLWNGAPDAPLLEAARGGRLSDPDAVEREVRRMLADDRARAFVSRFFVPWLELDKLAAADPDERHFPEYDVSIRESLARETELFVLSQLREDRDPLELWTAGYTFLDERLARHYGVASVTGPDFRRVAVTPERAGLLGHGSILMVTSRHQRGVDAAYTTPATRAKWVRLHFLGAPLPNGFPGAQPVKPDLPIAPQTRALPAAPCGNCHRDFFPLGYALENFDPLGRWRTHDQAGPVDVSGTLPDGSPTDGVVQLRQALLQYAEAFRTTVVEKLVIYSSTGSAAASNGTADTLLRARRVLRGTPLPRWSALIARIAQEGD